MSRRSFPPGVARRAHRGSAMIEFAVVAPIITLLGTLIIQWVMVLHARNLVNHAAFMAARAGSTGNADMGRVTDAYARASMALYGGGLDPDELQAAYGRARADMAQATQFEILNPTKESFDDWAEEDLRHRYGARAIPNGGLAFKSPREVRSGSGQSIHDANILKLKVTHGYELKVPLAKQLIPYLLTWVDTSADAFTAGLYQTRRIPLVTQVTLHMHSDPIEHVNASGPGGSASGNGAGGAGSVSSAGLGNQGSPSDPGSPEPPFRPPPNCLTSACTVLQVPVQTATPVDPGGGSEPLPCIPTLMAARSTQRP